MTGLGPKEVDDLLSDSSPAARQSLSELVPAVYDDLCRLARRFLARENRNHSLQPTALVHEAYLRLITQRETFVSRAHFLAIAARMMRRILVDHARRRNAERRGGGRLAVTLADDFAVSTEGKLDLLAIHEALEELSRLDARQARIVELRFFGGLTVEETAEIVGVSEPTVKRDWQTSKLFLRHALRSARSC
ncbi:MAG: sigma-70 family RNA polymerase sigma factor [Acidobacteria bacterium]|nr:sigma-70 family RNA polymerase sigma factor [Acidobacteriota bacterium]